MGIDTREQRAERDRAEAASREANIKRYEAKMGVQLPYSPVSVIERKVAPKNSDAVTLPEHIQVADVCNSKTVTLQPEAVLRNKPKSRADYMKKYRAREKKCPHCGGKL